MDYCHFDVTIVTAIRRAKQIVDEAIPYAPDMGVDTTMLRKSAIEITICEVLDFIRSHGERITLGSDMDYPRGGDAA